MKKESKKASMPKSVNSKKNNKCNVRPSNVLQFNGLKKIDGRYVCVVENKAIDLEEVAELLLSSILFFHEAATHYEGLQSKTQAVLDLTRTYHYYRTVKDILHPGSSNSILEEFRLYDEELYRLVEDEDTVNQLVNILREKCESPESPRIQFGNELIDRDYLSNIIEWGFRQLVIGLANKEDYESFSSTAFSGCIMVTQLRRMDIEEAMTYMMEEFGSYGKDCIEYFFAMPTIGKKDVMAN
jgi:hypothetical protein